MIRTNVLLPPSPTNPVLVAGLSLAASLWAAGCGDPLVTAQDRGDAVLGVHGQALSSAPVTQELSAAVLFMHIVPKDAGPADGGGGGQPPGRRQGLALQSQIIPGQIEGSFPAAFSVELNAPDRTYPFDSDIIYRNLDGTDAYGIFAEQHAPKGVRIGHLVIGPAAELASLPQELWFDPNVARSLGYVLRPYLPNTTITPYQVVYAEGVSSGDVLYPTRTSDGGVTGGLSISDGFSLVDARTYLDAVRWQECANDRLREAYADPEYQACRAANQGRISCVENCRGPDPDAIPACHAACEAQYPGQLDANGCLWQTAQPEIPQTCGAEKVPDPTQARLVGEDESLSVKLGDDDVKDGIWILHVTEP